MNTLWYLVTLLVFTQFVACRDFYLGMFKPNDFLVAQDVIYKAPAPFGYTTVTYGRIFKCPITYFRVVDRLGKGRGPFTTIVRGGLRKKFISVRIKSTYRLPVSVNIYVGCENKQPNTIRSTTPILTKPPPAPPPSEEPSPTPPSDSTSIGSSPSDPTPTASSPIDSTPIDNNSKPDSTSSDTTTVDSTSSDTTTVDSTSSDTTTDDPIASDTTTVDSPSSETTTVPSPGDK